MLLIVVALVVVMALAALVAYVAYPDRGEPLPQAAWLSDAAARLRERLDP